MSVLSPPLVIARWLNEDLQVMTHFKPVRLDKFRSYTATFQGTFKLLGASTILSLVTACKRLVTMPDITLLLLHI